MSKFLAIVSSVVLHLMFISGLAASATVATQLAADRASHILLS